MLLLALDTSTPAVTVALHDGAALIAERTTVDPMRHAELLAPGIAAVLEEAGAAPADLTDLAVGVGPGPFTGLRVGLVTARVLGSVLGLAVHGVCSLDVVAAGVDRTLAGGPFAVASDARRREVYWALYDGAGRRTSGPHVGPAADLASHLSGGDLPVAGAGPLLYPEALPHRIGPERPRAADLAAAVAAATVPVLPPDPLYLRRPDAREPGPRKRVLTR